MGEKLSPIVGDDTAPVGLTGLGALTGTSITCLAVVSLVLALCYVVAKWQWSGRKEAQFEQWIIFWCYYDAFTHLFMVKINSIKFF